MRAAPSTMSSGGWKRCSARLARGDLRRILVGHPAGVDAVHVDAVGVIIGGRGARHHVERGLGHVGVRMARGLEVAVELPFHRRHVDDVLVALRRAQHQRLQPRVDDERRDRVDQLHFQQLDRRHLGQQQPPGIAAAQIDLLQILIEPAFGKQIASAPASSSGSSGTCDSSAACVRPATSEIASALRRARAPLRAACDSRAALRTRRAACARARACRAARRVSPSIMCA